MDDGLKIIMTQLDRIEEQQKAFLRIVSQMHPDPKRWPIPLGCIQDGHLDSDDDE